MTFRVTHSTSAGGVVDPTAAVDGAAWDAEHVVEGDADDVTYITPARSQTQSVSAFTRLYINATLEGVPNDGTGDAAAKLQEIVNWVTANRHYGAFIDCSNGVFRMDSSVTVNGDRIVIGGAGHGQVAVFRRNHNSGSLFTFSAPGTGSVAQLGSGMRFALLQDIGTGVNGSGQVTGCVATNANSPYGLIFETNYRPVLDNIEFYNESLATRGVADYRPTHLSFLFNRTYDSGRIGWSNSAGTLAASATGKGAQMWADDVVIVGGVPAAGVGCIPAIDIGLRNSSGDGFYVVNFYAGLTKVANLQLNPNSSSSPIYNCGFSAAFIDLCLGDGVQVIGSEPILGFQFRGVCSAVRLGASSVGFNITNPVNGCTVDIERLEGWTASGVILNNANAKHVGITVGEAEATTSSIVTVNACTNAVIHLGNLDGGSTATFGVFLGPAAVNATVSGGKIANCSAGAFIDTGATNCGVVGVDLRSNTTPLIDNGTGTFRRANAGVADSTFGVGANVPPDSLLTANANTGAAVAPLTGTNLHMIGADGVNDVLTVDGYGGNAAIQLRVSGGTQAAKTVLASGLTVGGINGLGWDTTAYGTAGGISFRTSEVWTTTAHGGEIAFRTVLNGTTTVADALVVKNTGDAVVTRFVQTGAVAVASLPAAAAGNKGARYFVTDANATTFWSIVAGGGSNNVPVTSDGANWRIG